MFIFSAAQNPVFWQSLVGTHVCGESRAMSRVRGMAYTPVLCKKTPSWLRAGAERGGGLQRHWKIVRTARIRFLLVIVVADPGLQGEF